MVNLTVDGQKIQIAQGATVLEAARQAGVDMPTLCLHPERTPYGACRLGVVEVCRNGRSSVTT